MLITGGNILVDSGAVVNGGGHRWDNNAVHGSYKVVSMLFIAKAELG